ncbi:MAG: peptidoglycan-binding protein, partial [Faecalibacterium sp.]|nr:peptidoglycan-binding protein [Faecalibacterium sp.]
LKDVAETSSINSADDSAVSTPSSASRPTLRTGSRGDSVRLLQTLLNHAGYELAVDGIFGTMTRCSVKGFQSERGLAVDGIVGKQTWAALEGGGA